MAITTLNNRSINRSDTASADQVWTATSATASDFQASGGITDFDSWRLTADFDGSTGDIDGSWERQDFFSENIKLGTGMSESSGVFTFPSTGIWKIEFWTKMAPVGAHTYNGFYLYASSDSGVGYSYLTGAWGHAVGAGKSVTISANSFLNVTDASTYRVKAGAASAGDTNFQGNTDVNYTYFNFIRLGDST